MKTKNQTEPSLPEFAVTNAANEEGFNTVTRESSSTRKQASWSPKEVWRTRVKASEGNRSESAPV